MLIFHVLNRGVDKRNVVKDDSDRLRFVHNLFVMNDYAIVAHSNSTQRSRKRKLLVQIHAWCLMDNHYHLLLSPIDDDMKNLSLFMKKLNMGYAKYFNEKYKRSGYLWQGKYKKIQIQKDGHFLHMPYYIHLNPLDYSHKEWREGSVKNKNKALKELRKYRWSSYLDYIGTKNFPSLITQELLGDTLGSHSAQETEISKIISDEDMATSADIIE